ncbi:MAG: glycine cleavage system protein H [Desulfuromonadaceae bacterium]|nr:glycine cleavage system protein H [Desulfuromonadaceae bacterium]
MTEFLETTIDKFTFRVDTTSLYSNEGVWVRLENGRGKLGLSDFLQQRSGDIAFAEVKPAGTILALDDEFASIETVKANVMLASPVSGKVVQVNPALETTPELINQDPFGEGWVCEVELSDWDADRPRLLDAAAYFEKMKQDAEEAQRT